MLKKNLCILNLKPEKKITKIARLFNWLLVCPEVIKNVEICLTLGIIKNLSKLKINHFTK